MAFNLNALGAGLGIGADQIQRQQQQALARQISQIYMRQQQQAQQAKELEGLALASGQLPGFGGLGLPGSTYQQPGGISGAAPPAAPSVPTTASAAPPAPAARTALGPTGVTPLDDQGEGAGFAQDRARQLGVPVLDYDVEREAAPPSAAPGEPSTFRSGNTEVVGPASAVAAVRDEAPQAAAQEPSEPAQRPSSSGGQPGNLMVQLPGGQQMDLGALFNRVDPSAIAARIKQLRPNAPPAAIAMATESLYKMAQSGSTAQQRETALLLKMLMPTANFTLAEQGRNARAAATNTLRGRALDQADTRIGQGEQRLEQSRERAQQRATEFQQRLAQNDQKLQDARASKDTLTKRVALNSLLRTLEKQLFPQLGQPALEPNERAQVERQYREVQNELRAISGMGPMPAPPSTSLPGGGAEAKIP